MNTRKYSKRQEERVAKFVGGKRQPNSGATTFSKGDVSCDNMLIECKTATKEVSSISVKKEWIEKLREEAFAMGKTHCVLAFNFGETLLKPENFYIIDERLFKKLLQTLQEENNYE